MSASRQLTDFIFIILLVAFNTCGDLLLTRTMRRVGDVDLVRKQAGVFGVVQAVLRRPSFYGSLLCMASGFFSLLAALSLIDLSIVIPASSSLTFLANLLGAKLFLKEHVDLRRWIAGTVVICGVILLTIQ
jgi:drug/metabolite transporter (DMT)-like permease